jgi:F-type H+-transporting ATPase subunit c
MMTAGFVRKAMMASLAVGFALAIDSPVLFAQEGAAVGGSSNALAFFGAAIGLGMIVIGAGLGIGKLAVAAAEGIARQPSAAAQITGAVNLPLFLLEGVAILAEVFALLIVLMKN